MSNFTIFNQNHISKLINPFDMYTNPGMIPIKYEAITPDIFLFLFRNSYANGSSRYFVSIEFDYISGTKEAEEIINSWHGKIIKFLPLFCRESEENPDFRTISAPTDYPYFAMMAEVEPPVTGSGYWGENIIVKPGDDIDEKISRFTKKEQENIHKGLAKIFEHENKTDESIGEISIYKNKKGGFEFFYNKEDYNNNKLQIDEICRKLENTIKNNYADSIKDLADSIYACLIVYDDYDEYCSQYPILEKISNICNEIAAAKGVARQKKLLDEIKINISMLRNEIRAEF